MEPDVTAERPDSPFHTVGTDHITVIGSNVADTIEYYRDLLGMSLVLRQPNLDQPEVTHLFFDTGDGRILTFFVTDDRPSNPNPQRTGLGQVHHLAFTIEAERLEEIKAALNDAGYGYNEFDRGAFHSLYTRDHNGLTIELAVDKYEIPGDRRGEVLARAQQARVEAGAEYVDDEHMEEAIEALGMEVVRNETPDADSGVGGVE
ncbi:VOC family protein [Halopenitus persicus]|uniref:Glyoxalase/Bleomycin resistance protein/Dioxygenase superfamily protein n=1 Tax=Halopenitus persicus TaxID=1048396 RepID=A0A1H3M2S1_9EURY|nr:VOC family protein [Halopenitus persicus]SDY71037.1 Glyoxalase/Bleomycin resistance protein/Dioxygenase superfamily protein [Halopenitus persicus]